MHSYVLDFQEINKHQLKAVGGKGLNLGELSRIEGVQVPEGFCVTTEAYKKVVGESREVRALLEALSLLEVKDRARISSISSKIRQVIEGLEIPGELEEEIVASLSMLGTDQHYAVRSSATAEDLPTASFAGQQDTYLNIRGKEAVLRHIVRCWASLFTERAVTYRIQKGFDHCKVYLSVVIQKMIFPLASGIMFTADPVTSNRKVVSIDAGFGLGEALVSGMVNPDTYRVREGKILDKKISLKKLGIFALEEGGTEERKIEPERQHVQVLPDRQIFQLESLGRKIEAHFGCPQDIEWCLSGNTLYILQSRPITTLYPLPEVKDDRIHVFMSMGHQQMMTDPMKPLGISFFQFFSVDNSIALYQAGGRLYVDLTHDLASLVGRKILAGAMAQGGDPLLHSALLNLMKRKGFLKSLPRGKRFLSFNTKGISPAVFIEAIKIYRKNDPGIIEELIANNEASLRDLEQKISQVSGDELFAFILRYQKEIERIMYDPRGIGAVLVGLYAVRWINSKMEKWLGEKSAAGVLSQSVPYNVTSEMGLDLLDVADVVRKYPEVIEYFRHDAKDETFFQDLAGLEGGEKVSSAFREYLKKYGMRCTGEIDITRPRWSEQLRL
jgi:phosphoenolpyruvate synthase/pyruvate phosphate dikinase